MNFNDVAGVKEKSRKEKNMTHLTKITVSKAQVEEKAMDPAGALFMQVWLGVFTWILAGAFGKQ